MCECVCEYINFFFSTAMKDNINLYLSKELISICNLQFSFS